MKYSILVLIMSIMSASIFQSCDSLSSKKSLIGRWQVDSIMIYNKGKKQIITPKLDESDLVGTIYNKIIIEFNDFGEMIKYKMNDYQNRTIMAYELSEDNSSISFKQGDDLSSLSIWKIEKFNNNNLEYSYIDDLDGNKIAIKYYLSKLKPIEYSNKSFHGQWLVKESISYFTGEEIKIDTSYRQCFEISDTIFKIYYDKEGYREKQYESEYTYKIRGDSLIVNGWMSFFIYKCEKDEFIISNNAGMKLFGDFSGFTSYHVKVTKRIK